MGSLIFWMGLLDTAMVRPLSRIVVSITFTRVCVVGPVHLEARDPKELIAHSGLPRIQPTVRWPFWWFQEVGGSM